MVGLFGSVLFGMDEEVSKCVLGLLGDPWSKYPLYSALGVVKGNRLIGGVIYFNERKGVDIEISAAFSDQSWASRDTLKMLCGYPFNQLGCARATAFTARKNKAARGFLEKLGCRVEGVKRHGFDGKQDLIMYGLLKQDCKWLGSGNG